MRQDIEMGGIIGLDARKHSFFKVIVNQEFYVILDHSSSWQLEAQSSVEDKTDFRDCTNRGEHYTHIWLKINRVGELRLCFQNNEDELVAVWIEVVENWSEMRVNGALRLHQDPTFTGKRKYPVKADLAGVS